MPEPISKSGNEWSLEEIPAEEEILAGRGGSPEEALGGRGGGRWAAGEGGWVAPGNPPGEADFSSRGPPWGGPRELRQMA